MCLPWNCVFVIAERTAQEEEERAARANSRNQRGLHRSDLHREGLAVLWSFSVAQGDLEMDYGFLMILDSFGWPRWGFWLKRWMHVPWEGVRARIHSHVREGSHLFGCGAKVSAGRSKMQEAQDRWCWEVSESQAVMNTRSSRRFLACPWLGDCGGRRKRCRRRHQREYLEMLL